MEKQRHQQVYNTMMKGIPGDIIEDILVKLPVKSLIRFKCVSKPWRSLRTNPRFARRQLNHHLTNSHHRHYHNSLLFQSYGFPSIDHEDAELLFWNLEHALPKKFFPFPSEFDRVQQCYATSCCCDGILCSVYGYDSFVLWNPRFGEYKKITLSDSYTSAVVGFGYDSSIDDYKVVRGRVGVYDNRRLNFQNYFTVQVLTLKSNTWKTVDDHFPFTTNSDQPATTFNGGIYWFANDTTIKRRITLVCFDLAEEKFREVALPPDITRRNDIIPRLGLGGDCGLCMLTKFKSNIDLWVLNKGDSTTWAKLFTIPRLTGESFNNLFNLYVLPRMVHFC